MTQLPRSTSPRESRKAHAINRLNGLRPKSRDVLRPTGGAVLYKSRDVAGMKAWDRCEASIARTYQVPKPFTHMTTFGNVLAAAVHGAGLSPSKGRTRAMGVLNRTGLAPLAGHRAGSFRLLD